MNGKRTIDFEEREISEEIMNMLVVSTITTPMFLANTKVSLQAKQELVKG